MQNVLKLTALLSIACGSSVAAAPDPRPAPPSDACRPTGAVLFEIAQRIEPGVKLPTSTTKVFANGAWTRDETDAEGKALAQRAGCLARPDLQQLETTLRGAPWKITIAQVRCMAVSATFTVFQVHGKTVFTDKLCSGESLDDKSRTKLDAARAQVEQELGKPGSKDSRR